MDEFWKAVGAVDWSKPATTEYRIYYDTATGQILDYTTESRDGDFILVDRETFARHRFEPKIRDGKLVWPKPALGKLIPAEFGTPCHPWDITIICQQQDSQHWKIKIYED